MDTNAIDFPRLWATVESQFRGNLMGIHGKRHWQQVERNGLMLAQMNGLPTDQITVVRLFAIFHDSQRVSDHNDQGHGSRGGDYARQLHGTHFTLPTDLLKKLIRACERHELGETTPNPLIGTCWDADRLDLVRVGATPMPHLMNTPEGKRLARAMQGK